MNVDDLQTMRDIRVGFSDVEKEPRDWFDLTHKAFESLGCGDLEKLEIYLNAGAKTEYKNHDGHTMLIKAILDSNLAAVKLLLQKGADSQQRADGKPPLFYAVQNEQCGNQLIRLLLENGANINTVSGSRRMNALHWAAARGMVDAADYLLSNKIDIEATCIDNHTALHVAAGSGNLSVFKVLLAQGAELSKRNIRGESAMICAASKGHLEIAKLCIKEGVLVDDCDYMGSTALMSACEMGHLSIVEYLIDKGADINIANEDKITPASKAAARGCTEVLQTLENAGADLNFANRYGANAIEVAMSKGHAETVKMILASLGGPQYPLESVASELASARKLETIRSIVKSAALMHKHIQSTSESPLKCAWVKWILEAGGDLVRPRAVSNIILVAIADADIDLVEALLCEGADPNEFALSTAVVNQNVAVVQLLLEHGAGCTPSIRCIRQMDDRSPEILADALLNLPYQKDTSLPILKMLLDTGRFNVLAGPSSNRTIFWQVLRSVDWEPELKEQVAFMMLDSVKDVNKACDGDGGTLMHHVVRHGRRDMVDHLLKKGGNINARDNGGRTPFILACNYQAEMIPYLLERGADSGLQYGDERGPLHAAATAGNVAALELLATVSESPDFDQKSKNGWTPLSCALAADEEDAALYLMERGADLKHTVAANGRTMLHLAAAFGHERMFEKIMNLGDVEVNPRDSLSNSTPLMLACAGTQDKTGSTKIIRALIDAGADVEAAGTHFDRSLHIAIATNNTAVAEILIAHGADIAVVGSKNRTPLHLAAEYTEPHIMRLLLQKGAAVNIFDDLGWTPLHRCTDARTARIMLDYGAIIGSFDDSGLTSLHLAIVSFDVETFLVLLMNGASTQLRARKDGRCGMDMVEDLEDLGMRREFLRLIERTPLLKRS